LLPSSFIPSAHPSTPPAAVNVTHFSSRSTAAASSTPAFAALRHSRRRPHPSHITFSCPHAMPPFPFVSAFAFAPPRAFAQPRRQCH